MGEEGPLAGPPWRNPTREQGCGFARRVLRAAIRFSFALIRTGGESQPPQAELA